MCLQRLCVCLSVYLLDMYKTPLWTRYAIHQQPLFAKAQFHKIKINVHRTYVFDARTESKDQQTAEAEAAKIQVYIIIYVRE